MNDKEKDFSPLNSPSYLPRELDILSAKDKPKTIRERTTEETIEAIALDVRRAAQNIICENTSVILVENTIEAKKRALHLLAGVLNEVRSSLLEEQKQKRTKKRK